MRVYHEDVDTFGVVYYANYLRYMERARTEWLRAMQIDQVALQNQQGVIFLVASANLEFKSPAKFDDALRVSVKIKRLGRVSMELTQAVRHDDGNLLCNADVKVACVSLQNRQPCAIPASIYKELKARDE